MRALAFKVVSQISVWIILLFQAIGVAGARITGRIGYTLMTLIDKKRLSLYEELLEPEAYSELKAQDMELKLLTGASQVRDHAKSTGDWTDHHSDAIEAIGEALVGELGWEEDHVHQYLREIVESIDGLEYDVEG